MLGLKPISKTHMFCDKTKVKFIGGKGGNGCISFRREKFVSKGGPDGGDGGHGGNIILETDPNINTLSEFNQYKRFAAESGKNGQKKNQTGKTGLDLTLKVPIGTLLLDAETNTIITDLNQPNQKFVIVRGGKGGLGNARFVSSIHQAPKFAEIGEDGEEKEITMELKIVADIGIIGMPSAGKSTLISRISNAKPKIAAYHFTTLIPNLGVVEMSQFGGDKTESFVIADIPGLIPGAHLGKGLGHDFLRHISRTFILVHLLDGTLEEITQNYQDINKELKLYDDLMAAEKNAELRTNIAKAKQIVVINKTDAISEKELKLKISALEKQDRKLKGKIHTISAVTGEGIKELVHLLWKERAKIKPLEAEKTEETENQIKTDETSPKVFRPHLEKTDRTFTITLLKEKKYFLTNDEDTSDKEPISKIRRTFEISGKRIEQLVNMTDFHSSEAVERIYRYMQKFGIQKSLKQQHAETNDILLIAGKELKFRE